MAWGHFSEQKHRFLKSPEGVLLITPESLEALFVNRGSALAEVFQNLRYIVVDELHAFIGSERGKQLQSLMHRVEIVTGRRLPRVGLSATLGDMTLASEFLRSGGVDGVTVIESKNSNQTLQVQVRGYIQPPMSELKRLPSSLLMRKATKTKRKTKQARTSRSLIISTRYYAAAII